MLVADDYYLVHLSVSSCWVRHAAFLSHGTKPHEVTSSCGPASHFSIEAGSSAHHSVEPNDVANLGFIHLSCFEERLGRFKYVERALAFVLQFLGPQYIFLSPSSSVRQVQTEQFIHSVCQLPPLLLTPRVVAQASSKRWCPTLRKDGTPDPWFSMKIKMSREAIELFRNVEH